jgi:hypothetical protein
MGLTADGPEGTNAHAVWAGQVGGLASVNVGTRAAKYTLNNRQDLLRSKNGITSTPRSSIDVEPHDQPSSALSYILRATAMGQQRPSRAHPLNRSRSLLGDAGMPAVRVISIVAADQGSFAAALHRDLKERYGIRTVIHARVYPVTVDPSTGRKLTMAGDGETPEAIHHRAQSKLRLFWDGEVQKREWAY